MIRAVLFDMDGVLFDTEIMGFKTMRAIAKEYGYDLSKTFYTTTLGLPNNEGADLYRTKFGDSFPYEEVVDRVRAYYSEYNRTHSMPRKPGLMECLGGLETRGLKVALATSTIRPLVLEYFAKMPDIARHFDGMVCGGEVPHGKPAPDMYLTAAKAAGCKPEECVGVEDSFSGIRAIRASGARCVMIPDLLPYQERFGPYVDHLLTSLHELCPLIDRLNA